MNTIGLLITGARCLRLRSNVVSIPWSKKEMLSTDLEVSWTRLELWMAMRPGCLSKLLEAMFLVGEAFFVTGAEALDLLLAASIAPPTIKQMNESVIVPIAIFVRFDFIVLMFLLRILVCPVLNVPSLLFSLVLVLQMWCRANKKTPRRFLAMDATCIGGENDVALFWFVRLCWPAQAFPLAT